MSTVFKELYRNGVFNSAINAAASEHFCNTAIDMERKARYGSFNKVLIVNSSNNPILIALDGQADKTTILPSTGSYELMPEEGAYFNYIVITNNGAVQIAASAISVNYSMAVPYDVPTGMALDRERDARVTTPLKFERSK